ncbi:hypothetical protein CL652_00695 [bacterium]|nr:hypothetical protein [bacterium]
MSQLWGRYSKLSAIVAVTAIIFGTTFTFLFTGVRYVEAFPWGGQFQQVIPCFNNVIWVLAGPPRGGKYIWVPGATRTYNYGPPKRAGQWGLGLAAPPYFCIVSPLPLIVYPGIIMTMLGTSR